MRLAAAGLIGLIALLAALLGAAELARADDPPDRDEQTWERRSADWRLWRGLIEGRQPLTLTLQNPRERCTAGTTTDISWTISGGRAPYTLGVEGSTVDVSASSVRISCGALTEAEAADEDAALAAKTITAVVTDSRGVQRQAALDITRARIAVPTLSARTAASGSVVLSWSDGPTVLTRWEYRQRRAGGSWGTWTMIAGGNATTAEHTVSGLVEDIRYEFQLRVVEMPVTGPASKTASAVAGLTPPPPPITLQYNEYDANGGATARGAYAFLTNAVDLLSGISNYSEAPTATALLVNAVGATRRSYADVLNDVAVGDRFTWSIGSGCWFAYRVTAVLADPPAPARKLFAVESTSQNSCARSIYTNGWTYISISQGLQRSGPRIGIGADGIRILPDKQPVVGGHTYRLSERGVSGPVVIDVPAGMRLSNRGVDEDEGEVFLRDEASGAVLVLSFWTGRELRRYLPVEKDSSGETRDVGVLFDAIVASAREQPE